MNRPKPLPAGSAPRRCRPAFPSSRATSARSTATRRWPWSGWRRHFIFPKIKIVGNRHHGLRINSPRSLPTPPIQASARQFYPSQLPIAPSGPPPVGAFFYARPVEAAPRISMASESKDVSGPVSVRLASSPTFIVLDYLAEAKRSVTDAHRTQPRS